MTGYNGKLILLALLAVACVTECRRKPNGNGCLEKCGLPGLCSDSDFCVKGGGGLCCKKGTVEGACDGTVGGKKGYECTGYEDEEGTDDQEEEEEEETNDEDLLTVPDFPPMHCHKNATTLKTCQAKCRGRRKNYNVAPEENGFTTYIMMVGNDPMCFHAFLPVTDQPMPVVVHIDCRAAGAVNHASKFNFVNPNGQETWNARRAGYARVGIYECDVKPLKGNNKKEGVNDIMGLDINSPDMPKDGCETVNMVNANGTYAQPALQFMKRVVDWIYSQPKIFNASKIFLKGFSMSGGYGGEAFRCLSQKIAGTWSGGQPKVREEGDCDKVRNKNNWPCFREERPVVYCEGQYRNDYLYKRHRKAGVDKSIDCSAKENIKQTLFVFPEGSHKMPRNSEFWLQSCFGIGTFCNSDCEEKFMECMKIDMFADEEENKGKPKSAKQFPLCMAEMDDTGRCKGCAATLNMLKKSEMPIEEYGMERFGESYPLGADNPKPETSICNGIKVWP